MARPKRQRSEAAAALVTLAPTTRRRRSQAGYEPVDSEAVAPKLTRANSKREGNNPKKAASSKNDKNKNDTRTTDDLGNDHAVDEETAKSATSSQEELNRMQVDEENVTIPAAEAKDPKQQPRTEQSGTSTSEEKDISFPSVEPNAVDPAAQSLEATTKDRIRQVLEHRKVLLQRVVQSRTAAQKRLSVAGEGAAILTDEQEALEFAETMKKVSALARKQAQAENSAAAANSSGEPRRSLVSLRRGNSVGKRMNAAISTLMGSTGNNAVGDLVSGPSFSGVVPMKLANVMAADTNGEQMPTRGNLLPQHSLSTISSNKSIKRSEASSLGRSALKKSQSTASRSGDGQLLSSSAHKSVHPPPQLHHGMHPPHRIVPHTSPPPPPRIICPETAALRRRRDQIRSQLTHLIQSRSTTQLPDGGELAPIRSSEGRAAVTSSRPSVAMGIRMRSSAGKATNHVWQGPDLPPGLPPRRQTHWDVVLEEMRWMATDFLEERKWKQATARVLARQMAHDAHQKLEPLASPDFPLQPSTTKVPPLQKEMLAPKSDALSTEAIPLVQNGNNIRSSRSTPKVPELDLTASALGQNFHMLCAEDEYSARTIAKQISLVVSNAVISNNSAGPLASSAPTEFQKSIWTDGTELVLCSESLSPKIQNNETSVDPTLDATAEKAKMILCASNYVDGIMTLLSDQARDMENVSDHTEETVRIQLSVEQKEAIKIIEDRWHRIGIGAVLQGSLASGKTVATCALLGRHYKRGPQMLVCSSSNMTRWMHELRRFKCLNTKFFDGLSASNTLFASLLAGDVVVSLHASVERMPINHLAKFSSVVIDGRFPSGFGSSRANDISPHDAFCAPGEVLSVAWWTKLALATSDSGPPNRLLIESSYYDKAPVYLRNLPSRHYLEILSLRMAFVLGANCFKSPLFPLGKAILSWARHKTKNSSRSGSKLHQVTALLMECTKPLLYALGNETNPLENDALHSGQTSYELRRCPMTSIERAAYIQACRQSRSFLSRTLNAKEEYGVFANVAAALLLLRRHCTHPDIDKALRLARLQVSVDENDPEARNVPDRLRTAYISARSPSQRNLDFAFRVLAESSKLCHMVSVLLDIFGVEASCIASNIIAILSQDSDNALLRSNPQESRKKVVIIAALPEVQLLASALLNSIGVDHEILVNPSQDSSASSHSNDSAMESLNWLQAQKVLSKFNSFDDVPNSGVNIVITSLPTVAGEHGGIGVEAADTIIVLDEDWSGREEILMRALLCRCSRKRAYERRSFFRVLRLVAESSCEDVLLSSERIVLANGLDGNFDPPPMVSWPTTPFGTLSSNSFETLKRLLSFENAAKRKTSNPPLKFFGFPGRNVFSCCGQILDDVVGSPRIPQNFGPSSETLRFLPFRGEDEAFDIKAMILLNLVQSEEFSRKFHNPNRSGECLSITLSPVLPQIHTKVLFAQNDRITLPPLPLRVFLRRTHEKFSLQDTGPGVVLANNLSPVCRIDHVGETTDRVGRDLPLMLGRSSSRAALSVLFYKGTDCRSSPSDARIGPVRANFYSSCFCYANAEAVLHDGNQGSEALLYFPPIFPMMQECAAVAKSDQVTEKSSAVEPNLHSSVELVPNFGKDTVQNDVASVLVDLYDDYGLAGSGAIPLPVDSAYASCHTIARQGNPAVGLSTLLNDWFASTPLVDAEEYQATMQGNRSTNILRSSIVLLSRKRRRGQGNTFQFSRPNIGSWSGISSAMPDSALYGDLNGAGKKGKKPVSAFSQLPAASENVPLRQPTATLLRKDDYRYRLLSTLRQSGLGTTIFEAPIFRVATLRVRSKVAERILRESWTSGPTYEAIPGLVMTTLHHASSADLPDVLNATPRAWTTIANKLSTKNPVSRAGTPELSARQAEWFRRSHNGPHRVDFGPFQCGFLQPSDSSILPMKPKVGVSLPMGVKISQMSKEQALLSWDDQSDCILRRTVDRFGKNWILVAKVLSGFQGVSFCSQTEATLYRLPRSSRSCRERWLQLTSNALTHASMKDDEAKPVASDSGRRFAISKEKFVTQENGQTAEFLLPLTGDSVSFLGNDSEVTLPVDASAPVKERKSRRTFTAFQLGLSKQQTMPPSTTIATTVIPPCHPSHELAVQISITAANGRTDMWPLQILDGADRHRAAAAAAAAAVATSAASTASVLPTSAASAASRRAVSMAARPASSNSNSSRNRSTSSNRSPSTSTVPVQRPSSTSSAPGLQRPPSQIPFAAATSKGPVNDATHTALSKQSFAPPPPTSTKSAAPSTKATPPSSALKEETSIPSSPPASEATAKALPSSSPVTREGPNEAATTPVAEAKVPATSPIVAVANVAPVPTVPAPDAKPEPPPAKSEGADPAKEKDS